VELTFQARSSLIKTPGERQLEPGTMKPVLHFAFFRCAAALLNELLSFVAVLLAFFLCAATFGKIFASQVAMVCRGR